MSERPARSAASAKTYGQRSRQSRTGDGAIGMMSLVLTAAAGCHLLVETGPDELQNGLETPDAGAVFGGQVTPSRADVGREAGDGRVKHVRHEYRDAQAERAAAEGTREPPDGGADIVRSPLPLDDDASSLPTEGNRDASQSMTFIADASRDASQSTTSIADANDARWPADVVADMQLPQCPTAAGSARVGVHDPLGSAPSACGHTAENQPVVGLAIGRAQFDGAIACGMCVRLTDRSGRSVQGTVFNATEDHPGGHFTLQFGDYQALFNTATRGQFDGVSWEEVACANQANRIAYSFKRETSINPNFLALRVTGHRYRVVAVEIGSAVAGGPWVPLRLEAASGYWVGAGLGTGPFTIRSRDRCGAEVIDRDVPYRLGETVQGTAAVHAE